jgi:hypothetical protein
LLDPLDQFVAGRVPQRGTDGLLLQQLCEAVGLGALTPGKFRREAVEVDL